MSKYEIPVEATRGGAETMYPEYLLKIAKMPAPPHVEGLDRTKSPVLTSR